MIDIALKMLFGERAKYAILVSGICFSTILITQGMAMFSGILTYSYATASNIRVPIWVVDPLVQQVGENQPLRDTDVDRVRSVEGVAWAAPLYVGNAQARLLSGGATQAVTLVGLDSDTLAGAPTKIIEGSVYDLRRAQGVIVDDQFIEIMKEQRGEQLEIGDVFEMNDREAVIVGIAKVTQGMGGSVYVFTTWDRAKEYVPGQRKMLTHILAAPAPDKSVADITRLISRETALKAVTEAEFKEMSAHWMLYHTPIPFVIGLWVGIGFIIGLGISGQTFYTFVLENTRHLGTLKAMGVSNHAVHDDCDAGRYRRVCWFWVWSWSDKRFLFNPAGGSCTNGIDLVYPCDRIFFNHCDLCAYRVVVRMASDAHRSCHCISLLMGEVMGNSLSGIGTDITIRLSGVDKSFKIGDQILPVLKKVELSARDGEMVFVVGPSGCGKTTLLSVLCGTLRAEAGEVYAFGHELNKLSDAEVTRFRSRHVGFIFQQFNLFPTLTVAENVAIPLRIQGIPATKTIAQAREMLAHVGIPEKENEHPMRLSGGQQQRVAIARALVHNPSLIICDEPTSALDSVSGKQIMELLREIAGVGGRTVIVVTHDSRIYDYADRIAEMEDGRILRMRSPEKTDSLVR
jgi:putative ABC transport system permease protein